MKVKPSGIFKVASNIDTSFSLHQFFAEFVTFITTVRAVKPLIYQDSTSAITLVTEGGRQNEDEARTN
jgi:phage major head subunit gpT-like protein